MEKINIFFCDIRGTITNPKNEANEYDYQELVKNLEKIKKVDKLDNLFFSFISGDHMEDVLKFVEKIEPYIQNSLIELGPQFSSTHVFYNKNKKRCGTGKCLQMKLLLDVRNVNKIYYADDTLFYHELLKYTMDAKFPDVSYQSFILGNESTDVSEYKHKNRGIEALNDVLEAYIVKENEMNEEDTLEIE